MSLVIMKTVFHDMAF